MFFINKTRYWDPETMIAFPGASREVQRSHSPGVPSYYASTTFSVRASCEPQADRGVIVDKEPVAVSPPLFGSSDRQIRVI